MSRVVSSDELPVRTMFGPGAVGPSWGPSHGGLHFKGERKFHEVQNDSNWRAALKGEMRARESFLRLHPEMEEGLTSRAATTARRSSAHTAVAESVMGGGKGLLAGSPRAIADTTVKQHLRKMRNRVLAIKGGGDLSLTYPQPARFAKRPIAPQPPPPAIIAGKLEHSKHGWTSAPRSAVAKNRHHHPLDSHWTHRLSQPKHKLGETAYLRGDQVGATSSTDVSLPFSLCLSQDLKMYSHADSLILSLCLSLLHSLSSVYLLISVSSLSLSF